MEKLTLYDWLYLYASEGYTEKTHHVYSRQALQLYNDGFTIQRIGDVEGYPEQHNLWIDWSNPEPGTVAYKLFLIAQAAKQSSQESSK